MISASFEFPARHRRPGPQPLADRLRLAVRNPTPPTEEEWRSLGQGLLRGDPPADAAAEWLAAQGSEAFTVWEQVVAGSARANAPEPVRAFLQLVETRPSWVRDDLLAEGARVSHLTGASGLFALRDLSLMGGYQSSAINQTLLFTGALERGAARRLAETLRWHMACTATGGMDRTQEGFRATLRVRLGHALVRRHVLASPDWRTREWGLPVNQADMAATYLGFSVLHLLGARILGVQITDPEARAFLHLWRYIGWLMGVEEQWLFDDEQEGRRWLLHFLQTQPPPDDSGVALARALLEEPLRRHHRALEAIQRRYERARHLSLNGAFLGRRGAHALGLPTSLPWAPMLLLATVGPMHRLCRLVPGGRALLVTAGRAAQQRVLRTVLDPSR